MAFAECARFAGREVVRGIEPMIVAAHVDVVHVEQEAAIRFLGERA